MVIRRRRRRLVYSRPVSRNGASRKSFDFCSRSADNRGLLNLASPVPTLSHVYWQTPIQLIYATSTFQQDVTSRERKSTTRAHSQPAVQTIPLQSVESVESNNPLSLDLGVWSVTIGRILLASFQIERNRREQTMIYIPENILYL